MGGAGVGKRQGVGSGLLSHEAALAVPSALMSLTAGFEMEPGVPSWQCHQQPQSPRPARHPAGILFFDTPGQRLATEVAGHRRNRRHRRQHHREASVLRRTGVSKAFDH